jgi:CHAD domain-containing protein
MKKNEIEKVVHNHFKKNDKLFTKIITGFQIEDIHKFRTEIKKLKAFLHLLDMEVDSYVQFKITKKMKTFYGHTGIIRNLQLHLQNIHSHFENSSDKMPVSYIAGLEKEIEYWKENTKEFMDLHNNFYNDEEKIISELPDKLRKASIKKFVQNTVYELQKQLISLEDDETLHNIRKLLKNILYNWVYVKPYIISYSPVLSGEEEIETLTEMLGTFSDKCVGIVLLQTYYNDLTEEEEKIMLQKIEDTWKIEKLELKEKICSELKSILGESIIAAGLFLETRFD